MPEISFKVIMAAEKISLIKLEFAGEGKDQFSETIKQFINNHEGVTFVDILKLLYQSALGPHHIFDMMKENEIEKWIEKNLDDAEPSENSLTEKLYGKKWVKINLGAFKKKYGSAYRKLFEIFLKGREEKRGSMHKFLRLQDELVVLIKDRKIRSSSCQDTMLIGLVNEFITSYRKKGCPPLHHSRLYMRKNGPYLVVSSKSTEYI
jgi:hypothetical protein